MDVHDATDAREAVLRTRAPDGQGPPEDDAEREEDEGGGEEENEERERAAAGRQTECGRATLRMGLRHMRSRE